MTKAQTNNVLLDFPNKIEILGVKVDPWTIEQTVKATDSLIKQGKFAHLIGVNADKVLQIRDDAEMREIVHRCEIVNADGASMVFAAKRLGLFLPERVAGIDLMEALCLLAAHKGYNVYLLGAKAEIVSRTERILKERHPQLTIVGYRDGYFNEDDYPSVINEVLSTGPDIVFVGITSPKKERLIEQFRESGAHGVFVGVGGSFDVVSGAIPRAPMWMQRANLEWLFRMAQEPRRLIRRYVVGNTRFLLLLHSEIVKGKREGK